MTAQPLDPAALRKQAEADLELAQKATPGPWEIEHDGDVLYEGGSEVMWPWRIERVCNLVEEDSTEETSAFIAASRAAWPASARAVLALVEEVERLKAVHQDISYYLWRHNKALWKKLHPASASAESREP